MVIHSVFLPGESHGQRSLVGCSPWGHKELDTTEHIIVLRHLTYRRHNLNVESQRECGDSFFKNFRQVVCVCLVYKCKQISGVYLY